MAKILELTREFISDLKKAIHETDDKNALLLIKDIHAADIAEIYNELTINEARYLYLLLNDELAADVLAELDEDDRESFLELLPSDIIAQKFIDHMDSDDAADVIGEMDEEKKQEVLSHLDDLEQAGDIVDLLAYDEDSAGGLMGKELIEVNENWTIITCLKEIARQADEVDEVYYLYVINDDNILLGIVSLKKIALERSI